MPDADPRLRNHLANETSPYLLQHAANPVAWFPWGDEAFALARELDRPVFLSVGYSTCYWCHVMERESFEDPSVARVLNDGFVAIKVDREERPDVDDVYMAAVQLLNRGQGGWPMSVWLEPDTRRPFLAGTYFPPEDGPALPSFTSVLGRIGELWRERRDDLREQAGKVAEAVARQLGADPGSAPAASALGPQQVREAGLDLLEAFDPAHGGFDRGRNKFPTPVLLDFLRQVSGDLPDPDRARHAVRRTLDAIAAGGVHDQLGGGFHRYAVDRAWLVPHFEKMLYDNGQLLATFARAYRDEGLERDARVLRSTIDWIEREMRTEGGGLASAQDAEVDAREGRSFLWTAEEVRAALSEAGFGADEIGAVLAAWGLDRGPNFRDPHHADEPPRNVLYRPADAATGLAEDALEGLLERARGILRPLRDARPQPMRDDKVLAGWNGLAIAGLAEAARALGTDDGAGRRALRLAEEAADFVLGRMRDADGRLLRVHRAGTSRIDGFLEDHAWLARGLVALGRVRSDEAWWQRARELTARARERFRDPATGVWWSTPEDQPDLFVRVRGAYDGATPSPAGVMLEVLLDLHEHDAAAAPEALSDAAELLRGVSAEVAERPAATVVSTAGLHRMLELAPDLVPDGDAAGDGSRVAQAVEVEASPLEVSADAAAASGTVTLRIGGGLHVTSESRPGMQGASVALDAAATARDDLRIEAAWPAAVRVDGPDGGHAGYVGRVPVRLEARWDPGRGVPEEIPVVVRWQACDEGACLAPGATRLGLKPAAAT